ncbi:enoyl-CoA hydratase/isomerase family protein [Cognatiyoonia sp.]|uniref:enoyl-CoA hydratase/isomerase family protein n=1 Tax=Cognatiyoonia sp. TaxID=2211652 RepID=UPI003F698985
MTDIFTRIEARAGRITLNRPDALNALTWEMCRAIEAALEDWAEADIDLLIIDAVGDKAFCAGGDIQDMYDSGLRGDLEYGRTFWRDEYRMNAKLFEFPKPVVTFLQGFTMGGGVGVGCHGSHRIVCDSSQIALPECAIGLLPDVGSTLLLARAPGRLGEFLGVTGYRMSAGDAIHAEFSDYFIPYYEWDTLKSSLISTGAVSLIDAAAKPEPESTLAKWQADIDAVFGGETLGDIMRAIPDAPSDALTYAQKAIAKNAPLAMCVAVAAIHRVRMRDDIRCALDQEYRFTHRAVAQGDFIEGIRAAIIDRDKSPKWAHDSWKDVRANDVLQMTLPLVQDALAWED